MKPWEWREGFSPPGFRAGFRGGTVRNGLTHPVMRARGVPSRAVRLVVDTGIHAERWTREQAIAYMLDKTGMGEKEVTAEIDTAAQVTHGSQV